MSRILLYIRKNSNFLELSLVFFVTCKTMNFQISKSLVWSLRSLFGIVFLLRAYHRVFVIWWWFISRTYFRLLYCHFFLIMIRRFPTNLVSFIVLTHINISSSTEFRLLAHSLLYVRADSNVRIGCPPLFLIINYSTTSWVINIRHLLSIILIYWLYFFSLRFNPLRAVTKNLWIVILDACRRRLSNRSPLMQTQLHWIQSLAHLCVNLVLL